VRLHVHEWGPADAEPLLCLHGVTSWGGRFRRLAEERLGAFRVVAPDLRGHGLSDWEPPWNLRTHTDDLVETLDVLHLERVDVVGHSFGGRLGLELAASRPERVRRLVLLDPAVWVPPPVALERAELAREDESYRSPDEAVLTRLETSPHADPSVIEAELRQHLFLGEDGRWRPRFARSAVVAAYGEMAKPPPLERVQAATLLVRGADSEVVPDPLVEITLETMPHCELVTVPGGHIVMWEAFDETAAAMLAFLEDSRPQRAGDQVDRERPGLVGNVEDRVDLDDVQ
jgi:lipase